MEQCSDTCSNAAQWPPWIVEMGKGKNVFPWNAATCSNTALKWARANQCLWDKMTCSSAALNGHLKLLKWERENQCPWDELMCSLAAQNGHLDSLSTKY